MKKDIQFLFIDELQDVLSAENQIIDALPEMINAANSPELKKAFESHLRETKVQVQRIEKIFKLLKHDVKEKVCKAMRGLVQECKEGLKTFDGSPVLDAALISKAQRIEHYEISAYGTLRTFAEELGLSEIAQLLQETLEEEVGADRKMTLIAEGSKSKPGVNFQVDKAAENKRLSKV